MLVVMNDNNADSYDDSNVNCYGWIIMLVGIPRMIMMMGAKRLSSIMECVSTIMMSRAVGECVVVMTNRR